MRLLSTVALAAALLSGCDTWNCETACSQYYGDDGCAKPSLLSDGTTADAALEDCRLTCENALYTVSAQEASEEDDRGFTALVTEDDALAFIACVEDKDYSEAVFAQTCNNLAHDCTWFQW